MSKIASSPQSDSVWCPKVRFVHCKESNSSDEFLQVKTGSEGS